MAVLIDEVKAKMRINLNILRLAEWKALLYEEGSTPLKRLAYKRCAGKPSLEPLSLELVCHYILVGFNVRIKQYSKVL